MRTVFFGTPPFAVPTLAAMVEAGELRPALVVSQPDRPAGRGRRLRPPAVAAWAREHDLPLAQPERVREAGFMDRLRALEPDVAVVVAFGQIFRRSLLELPRHGCINLHASLLPRWRGAAPIQAAIAHGDARTGITTMRMEAGLDTGPILLQEALAIGPDETAPELAVRLAARGAALMVRTLRALERGAVEARPQDDALATLAPRLAKEDGVVAWSQTAREIYDRWRAYVPWPGLVTSFDGEPLKLVAVRSVPEIAADVVPGTLLGLADGAADGAVDGAADGAAVHVACGGGTILALERVQRPGRRPIPAADWFRGARIANGATLGSGAGAPSSP